MTVLVAIPYFGAADYIGEAVASAVGQTADVQR